MLDEMSVLDDTSDRQSSLRRHVTTGVEAVTVYGAVVQELYKVYISSLVT